MHTIGYTLWQPEIGTDGDSHLIPEHDVENHIMSRDCPCKPFDDPEALYEVFCHRAFDQREAYEQASRKPH